MTSPPSPAKAKRVLVTDARLGSAVALIRSLGRSGMHVIAADSHRTSAGFFSRYASESVRYPRPEKDPEALIDTLLHVAADRRVDLIFPVTDEIVLPLARARERFDGIATLALPPQEALATTLDKPSTMRLAESLGIPVPRSAFVTTPDEAVVAARGLGWPVVLKPAASRSLQGGSGIDAFGVAYANDPGELVRRITPLAMQTHVLLQEYCGGEARGVGALAHEGKIMSAFQYRRLREVPLTGGPSSLRESVELHTPHYDYAARLLGALGWTGLAMVEFKGAPEAPKLMEINGRVWGSLALAVKSGVDFPAQAAALHLGEWTTAGPTLYTVGVRSRDLRLELSWIAAVLRGRREYSFLPSPRRREALVALARLAVPRDGFDVLSARDPLPGIAEFAGLAPRLYRKARAAMPRVPTNPASTG